MRKSSFLGAAALGLLAGSGLRVSGVPAVRYAKRLGKDGTEYDPTRTTSKETKRKAFRHPTKRKVLEGPDRSGLDHRRHLNSCADKRAWRAERDARKGVSLSKLGRGTA